jgi:6-pyruvoyltetrahydropterin/6-carboxytetrahydropterin synthase
MKMTRKVSFSSGHRYWFAGKSREENEKIFGAWASPYNHGHNYVLDVEVEGSVAADTGMVVNIKDVDAVLKKQLLPQFINRSINDEISYFGSVSPTLENLMSYVWAEIEKIGLPKEATLTHIKLEEMPLLYGEYWRTKDGMKTTITRVYEFAASHRLHSEGLSKDRNIELYAKCNNLNGHGHNYLLEVTIGGEPDAITGMIASIDEIDARVEELVLDRYDHKNLDLDVPELKGRITTSEIVSQEIFAALEGKLPAKLERIRLHETARNIFEVSAS